MSVWMKSVSQKEKARVGQARYFLVDIPSEASRSGSQRKLELELDGGSVGGEGSLGRWQACWGL